MSTLLCVPIMVQSVESGLDDAQAAKDAGADLVEYRIDELFSGVDEDVRGVLRLVAQSPLPCIVTCRAPEEGGHYDGDEMARVSLYERLGTAGAGAAKLERERPPAFLDIELESYVRSENVRQKVNLAVDHPGQRRDMSTSLILSNHDFNGRPADLSRRVARMRAEGAARVLKFAFRCRTLRDNLEIFELLAHRERPMIVLGMGEFGLMSRVLAPKFGGFLTFAALKAGAGTAPGQPTVRELLDLYRFRAVKPTTGVYGVIGWPIGHSKSPLVHNAVFEAIGFDGVYLPLPIPGEGEDAYLSFKATVGELIDDPRLTFRGASVTLPHKEHLVRLARERGWALDAVSAATGSANTIVVERDVEGPPKSVRVLNTDVAAAVEPLLEALGGLQGKRVAVLGAGGVARGIASGLAVAGAEVTVFNRTRARAEALAQGLPGVRTGAWERRGEPGFDAYVNATLVGMRGGPAEGESPLPSFPAVGPGEVLVALDTVYNPPHTMYLRAAAERGWRTIDGVTMFVRQASKQSEAWTGRSAPEALMDRVVRESLGGSGA